MDNTILFETAPTFAVPCEIVDRFLSAPETELRLILFLLRNANTAYLKDDLMTRLGVDEPRLTEAFSYWIKNGVLCQTAGKYTVERPRLTASDFMKYNPETIAQRLENDEALKYLYTQAEDALKKPLTSSDASAILSLVDWCGLPADVVALLLRYGAENGQSLRQIEKTGVRWADNGVNTFEKAEELIRQETQRRQTVNRIAARFGIYGTRAIAEKEREAFLRWVEEYRFNMEMIGAAYEATIKGTGKYTYTYLDRILTKWHDAGYTSPDQVAEAPVSRNPARKPSAANAKRKPAAAATDATAWAWQIADNETKE